jgi:phage-related protein
MADQFTWAPTVSNSTGDTKAVARAAQYDDGYQQRVASGLNNVQSSFSLQFVGDATKIRSIRSFLRERGGAVSFEWTPVLWDEPGLFYCEKWSEPTKDGDVYTMTAQFVQTFQP